MMPSNFTEYVKAWALETEGYWHFGYYGKVGTSSSLYQSEPQSLIGIQINPSGVAAELSQPFSLISLYGFYSLGGVDCVCSCISQAGFRQTLVVFCASVGHTFHTVYFRPNYERLPLYISPISARSFFACLFSWFKESRWCVVTWGAIWQ